MEYESGKIKFLEFKNKINHLKPTDVKELHSLLDEISSSSENFDNRTVEEILICFCKLLPIENDHILSKFCSLIYIFTFKHKIALSITCLHLLLKFICDATQSCGTWVLNDVLAALSSLLFENSSKLETFYVNLVGVNGILINLITPKKCEPDIQYNALLCLKSLLKRKQGESSLPDNLLQNCSRKCVEILKENKDNISVVSCLKLIVCSLKCLQLILQQANVPTNSLGEILGILKCLSCFGLPGQTCIADVDLHPTLVFSNILQAPKNIQECDASVQTKFRRQKKNRRSKTKKNVQTNVESVSEYSEEDSDYTSNTSRPSPIVHYSYRSNWTKTSSSDSEFSDTESQVSRVKFLQVSVRRHAYEALLDIIKTTDKKLMFGYWSSFFPDFPTVPGVVCNQNIFTSILKDPSPQVRCSALALLAGMLKGSKPFLSYADDSRNISHMSFTSLSSVLASMINELHRNLLLVLLSEKSPTLLTQVLKCYAVLGENVPYKKLKRDLLNNLLKHVEPLLLHKDAQVQVACLSVLTSLVNSDQLPEEMLKRWLPSEDSTEIPMVFQVCEKNILESVPLPVRLESLQLLCSIVGKSSDKLKFCFPTLEKIILFCVNDNDYALQLHGARLLEVLGRCINSCGSLSSSTARMPEIMLWQQVLSSPLMACSFHEAQKTLQSVCCDCLATIPPGVFQQLDSKVRIRCLTLVLGFACDPNAALRGAAVRCLGVFSVFPCLQSDLAFLHDVAGILVKAVGDSSLNVRLKASWAFGNWTDAMFLNREDFSTNAVSVRFYCTAGQACVDLAADCDRVSANAVRALGNFLRYVPYTYLDDPLVQDFILKSSASLKLALQASNAKLCWNSCYAIANLFKNIALLDHKIIDVEEMLNCLMKVLKSPNFKVRIGAVQALTLLPARAHYGALYGALWLQLVSSLYSAVEDVNFREIRHQEHLCDQICYSLCQMAVFLTEEDAAAVAKASLEAGEILRSSMGKFGQRATEDKITTVCTAREHLSTVLNDNTDSEAKLLLAIFQEMLTQVEQVFSEERV